MSTRIWFLVVIVLLILGLALAWTHFSPPGANPIPLEPSTTTPSTSTTTQEPTPNEPMHARVKITTPASGATVSKDFEVTGEAPGAWYFEASFPIQVRDKDNNLVGQTHANALGEWMTENQVKFNATVHVDSYTGPATLVLLKDNPSGLPENDDSTEIPIVIQ